jgi:hypothetical protein
MVRVQIDVDKISYVLEYYNRIKIYRADSEAGSYVEITDETTRIEIIPEKTQYFFNDDTGTSSNWYKSSYYNSDTLLESVQSEARQGGTEAEKVGWTFGNYAPPAGEWGKLYTADDMRYTMLFGIDCIGSDIAETEFTDQQFDQIVEEAVGEFEELLTMDIRRKRYMTFSGARPKTTEVRARKWRVGVDYTHEEDPYDFEPNLWQHFGFIQLRHYPVIEVLRANWYSVVKGDIIDMASEGWVRLNKRMGQINLYPQGGFSYGPYSVYGPLWAMNNTTRYPGAFEFDYETGYESSEFVPESLRSTIAKYATIKVLAVVGDGLLAGFSSQSVSLDGLSESFSSTQSATSAYFGARIKAYSDEITEWLKRNRYKYAPVPMSFVGG